jgi:hypothetical protein
MNGEAARALPPFRDVEDAMSSLSTAASLQMSERQNATLLLCGVAHYREIASKLRVVAQGCNFPNVRKDLIDLAALYDRRADHFDRPRGADGRLGVLSM